MDDKRLRNLRANLEDKPISRQEYISALVHLYRGELTRANTWRIRLDTTTNWAIFAVMGLLSFAFNVREHSHASIVLGMLLVLNFLLLESRRYRFFDVWRNRVRMIEENFYGPMLTRELNSPLAHWGFMVADDLLKPRFKISFMQALKARLNRNYWALFIILLISWITKTVMHPEPIHQGGEWLDNLTIGPIPWWVSCSIVIVLYISLLLISIFVSNVSAPEEAYWSAENPMGEIQDF